MNIKSVLALCTICTGKSSCDCLNLRNTGHQYIVVHSLEQFNVIFNHPVEGTVGRKANRSPSDNPCTKKTWLDYVCICVWVRYLIFFASDKQVRTWYRSLWPNCLIVWRIGACCLLLHTEWLVENELMQVQSTVLRVLKSLKQMTDEQFRRYVPSIIILSIMEINLSWFLHLIAHVLPFYINPNY